MLSARVVALVVPVAQAAEAVAEGLPVRVLFLALPVALVHAPGDHLGLGDVAVVRPRHGLFLAHRHADTNVAGDFLTLGDVAVLGDGPLNAFVVPLTLHRGELFDALLGLVGHALGLVRLRDAHGLVNGSGALATTPVADRLVCAGGGSSSHRGDSSDQQSDADGLPYHAISFVAVLADPPVHGDAAGGIETAGITSPLICPTQASAAGQEIGEIFKSSGIYADRSGCSGGAGRAEGAGNRRVWN